MPSRHPKPGATLIFGKSTLTRNPCVYQGLVRGGKGIRTPDLQLAKLPLYQLSYAPGHEARTVASVARFVAGKFRNFIHCSDTQG